METSAETQLSFGEHLAEMRKRIVRSFLVLGLVAGVAFAFSDPLVDLLQRPLQDKLYYFSPAGGFSFSVQVAILVGLIIALPVLIYNFIKFVSPAFQKIPWKYVFSYVVLSVLLAFAGVAFAYFVSLPPALRILKSLSPSGVEPLIGAEDYAKFVMIYLAGYALLFQLPLIINFIDRIKPLKPRKLNHYQRHAFAGSFIVAAILTPTPDVFNQAIFALPMVLLFEVSLGIIVFKHWRRQRAHSPTNPDRQVAEAEVDYQDIEDLQLPPLVKRQAVSSQPSGQSAKQTQPLARLGGFDISRRPISS
jgi:sec-independent protein translocase protein TatC